MPIDLGQVDWLYVAVLSIFVFVAALLGNLLSLNNRLAGAVLAALAFAAIFVAWTYYPHGLPLPTSLAPKTATMAPAPVPTIAPAAPARPRNPVSDVTPPATPR